MNYTLLYQKLCTRGQQREKIKGVYYEKHHITPKCMGGNNSISNITILTAREHFIVHRLLCKMHGNASQAIKCKLSSAFNQMCANGINQKRFYKSKEYDLARRYFSENHPMKNPEIRNKVKKSHLKRSLILKRLKYESLPLCKCGCGCKVKDKRYKYLYNHWDHTTTKKGFTSQVKGKLSTIAKERIEKLSDNEKKERLKKSLHNSNVDHIMRGKKISLSKKGKKTNQNEITGKRLASMSDKAFEEYIKSKSHYVWNRFKNLRETWKNKL